MKNLDKLIKSAKALGEQAVQPMSLQERIDLRKTTLDEMALTFVKGRVLNSSGVEDVTNLIILKLIEKLTDDEIEFSPGKLITMLQVTSGVSQQTLEQLLEQTKEKGPGNRSSILNLNIGSSSQIPTTQGTSEDVDPRKIYQTIDKVMQLVETITLTPPQNNKGEQGNIVDVTPTKE